MPNTYPRTAGSETVVHEKDWYQEAPFGFCPACGSLGIEELHITGDPEIAFYCSDLSCQTIMGRRRPARTKWHCEKPAEIIRREVNGDWSWNQAHFPGLDFPLACPD
jgi:hypothetical protein